MALNRERQEIEARVIDEATPLAEAQAAEGVPIIAVSGEGWRQGVVGIVASRMAERFERPALVAAIENGIAVGSGRSVSGVDLGPAIIRMREAGLLTSGGGHAMAAGFRCSADGFEAFTTALADALADDVACGADEAGILARWRCGTGRSAGSGGITGAPATIRCRQSGAAICAGWCAVGACAL